MKYTIILLVLVLIAGCKEVDRSRVTDTACDAVNRCPDGLECYDFKDDDSGPRCADPDPCSYYCRGECLVLESYPEQIVCG